jgi:hypothetical protein
MLVNKSLYISSDALNHRRQCFKHELLLALEVPHELILSIKRVKYEVFEVRVVISQVLCQALVLSHENAEAGFLVANSCGTRSLEVCGEVLRDLNELLLLLRCDFSKFLILCLHLFCYLLNLCYEILFI